jgi:hypothetical protein
MAAPEGAQMQTITINKLNGAALNIDIPEGSSVAEVKAAILQAQPGFAGGQYYQLVLRNEVLNNPYILQPGDRELTLVKRTMYISSNICPRRHEGHYRIAIDAVDGVYSLVLWTEKFSAIKYPGISNKTPPNSLEFKVDEVEEWQFRLKPKSMPDSYTDNALIQDYQEKCDDFVELCETHGDNLSSEIIFKEYESVLFAWLFRPNEALDLVKYSYDNNDFSKAINFDCLIIKALCKLHKNDFEAALPFSVLFNPIISLIISSTDPIPATEFINAVDLSIQNYVTTILEGPKT